MSSEYVKRFREVATLYNFVNAILVSSFFWTKSFHPLCDYLYSHVGGCQIEIREYEIFIFLALIVMVKNRRSTSAMHYLSTLFTFGKIGNLILYYRCDVRYALVFGIVSVLQMILLPQPEYSGQESITYFRGPYLHEELERDKRITWVIAFYAGWSPPCVHLQPVFAELSLKFGLENLRFGKIDVGKYPKEAERFRINTQPTSKQLPTIILFRSGHEVKRRPVVNYQLHCLPYVFSRDNIIYDFDMNTIYQECKDNPLKSAKKSD